MRRVAFLLLLSLLVAIPATSQMSQFKALFLFNFAKNVDWAGQNTGNEFVITIIGNDDLTLELKNLAKIRKIGSKTLVIKEVSGADNIEDSQIIYLSASKSSLMPILASYQKGKPALLVGDKQGLCAQGAGISFFTTGGRLQFEICPPNVEGHGLKMSQKLIALGSLVQ